MRRKQKRLLQVVGLALAALVFLPNVGLWSLYRERQLDGGSEKEGGGAGGARGMAAAAVAAPAGVAAAAARGEAQVRAEARPPPQREERGCRGGGGGGWPPLPPPRGRFCPHCGLAGGRRGTRPPSEGRRAAGVAAEAEWGGLEELQGWKSGASPD